MATNTAATSTSYSAAVCTLRTRSPVTWCSPCTASTLVEFRTTMVGWACSRATVAVDDRNRFRWWMRVTRRASGARNRASSVAASPPPTTATSWPVNWSPSRLALALTPWPRSSRSPGTLRGRLTVPIARIRAPAWRTSSLIATDLTALSRLNPSMSPREFGAETVGLRAHRARKAGPVHGFGETGVVVHLPGGHQCTAAHVALDHQGVESRACGVDGSGVARGT